MEPNPYESPSAFDAAMPAHDARPTLGATLLFGLYIGAMFGATMTPAGLAAASLIAGGGDLVRGVYLAVFTAIVGCFAGAGFGGAVGILMASIARQGAQRLDTLRRVAAVVLMGLPISFLWATIVPDDGLSLSALILQGMCVCVSGVWAGKWLHLRLKRFVQP